MPQMPHMLKLKLKKNIVPKYRYIYINVASIHAVQPSEEGAVIYYGAGEDSIYVEHRPADIVSALDNGQVCVRDGDSIGDD